MDKKADVYTVGHSNRSLEEFMSILQAIKIHQLVDIRIIPKSRNNPQFDQDHLPDSLKAEGIHYLHLPELGGRRRAVKESPNKGWRNASFRGYADYMLLPEFEQGLETLIRLMAERTTVIMCAEAVPWRCHRSLVADALKIRGFDVVHIVSPTSLRPHQITSWAVVEGTRILYPETALV